MRGPNLSFSGVGAGMGAGIGLGVATGKVAECVFDFTGAVLGSVGSAATGKIAVLAASGCVGVEVDSGKPAGVGMPEAGVFGVGLVIAAVTVVADPAGTDTSTLPALVSTVPLIVTMVVSPLGETETYESDPARMTEAIPALRTS